MSVSKIKPIKLKKYQKRAVKQVVKRLRNGINPVLHLDTGLGKTICALEIIKRLKYDKMFSSSLNIKTVLIVCKSANKDDPWHKEINRKNSDTRTIKFTYLTYEGTQKERQELIYKTADGKEQLNFQGYDIIIMSYDILANDIMLIKNTKFDLVVFDEIHNMFDKKYSKKNVKKISDMDFRMAVGLTATPMRNSALELYYLSLFMEDRENLENAKNSLGKMREAIKEKREKNKLSVRKKDIDKKLEEEIFDSVKNKYRKKYFVSLSKYQVSGDNKPGSLNLYKIVLPIEKCISNYFFDAKPAEKNSLDIAEHIVTFPQKYKRLLKEKGLPNNIISSKEIALKYILKSKFEKNEKCLVFSSYVEDLNYISGKFYDFNPILLIGEKNSEERTKRIEFFQKSSDFNLLLLSLDAFSEGINLQVANNVIFLNVWYNPTKILQARDRAFRTGQKKEVSVYYLTTEVPAEENMWKISEYKNNQINKMFFEKISDKFPKIKTIDYKTYRYEKSEDFKENVENFIIKFLNDKPNEYNFEDTDLDKLLQNPENSKSTGKIIIKKKRKK